MQHLGLFQMADVKCRTVTMQRTGSQLKSSNGMAGQAHDEAVPAFCGRNSGGLQRSRQGVNLFLECRNPSRMNYGTLVNVQARMCTHAHVDMVPDTWMNKRRAVATEEAIQSQKAVNQQIE